MAKNKEKEKPAGDAPAKSKKPVLMIILAVVFGMFSGVGGLVLSMGPEKAMTLVMGGGEEHPPADEHMAADEPKAGEDPSPEGAVASLTVEPLKEMIVNIVSITDTGRKRNRFLKLNLALAVDETKEGANLVTERDVYIRDSFQNYLRQLTERDLSGSIGVIRLKSELLRRARAVTESEAPQEVLIADIIVQ